MTERNLTIVELVFYPEYINFWLRFGQPVQRIDLDRRRALAVFGPGQIFGYVRWHANEFGTQAWSFSIGKTRWPNQQITRLEGVRPGAAILLSLSGAARVRRALKRIDRLESQGVALEDVSASYYRHLHCRVLIRSKVRSYSATQHAAHLAARKVRI